MKTEKNMVEIIMPTYNGERYVAEQIESILHQSYKNIRLYIRDDNSKDNTKRIIEDYAEKYPGKIMIVHDNKGNLGVANNVLTLLQNTIGPYVMMADQDDVWLSKKVKSLLLVIKKREAAEPNIPILVYGDAYVTDKNLKIIAKSFQRYAGLKSNRTSLANMLQVNPMQGASCIFNKKVLELIKSPGEIRINKQVYHDWWIPTIVSSFGKIYEYKVPLMYYRQHSSNVVGAIETLTLAQLIMNRAEQMDIFRYKHYLSVNRFLCKDLLKYYNESLTQEQKKIIKYFLETPNATKKFFELHLQKQYTLIELMLRVIMTVA